MWVLIFWMASPFSLTLSDAMQPTLTLQTREFNSEKPVGMLSPPSKTQ